MYGNCKYCKLQIHNHQLASFERTDMAIHFKSSDDTDKGSYTAFPQLEAEMVDLKFTVRSHMLCYCCSVVVTKFFQAFLKQGDFMFGPKAFIDLSVLMFYNVHFLFQLFD